MDTWINDDLGWQIREEWQYYFGLRRHAMVYDAARDRLVMFGGDDGDAEPEGTVWECGEYIDWDYVVPPGAAPSARFGPAMAFDAARGVSVLFGGVSHGNHYPNDTWTWNGAQWQNMGASGPSPRFMHSMAYDAARQVVVLFGGYQFNGHRANDTWEWNGVSWSLRAVSGPSPRQEFAMAYDAGRGVTMLFGGYTDGGPSDELWEWNGSIWTRRFWNGEGPSPRYGATMHYDPVKGHCAIFGGVLASTDIVSESWILEGPCSPVVIASQPQSISGCVGAIVAIQPGITGTLPRTIQWQARLAGTGSWSTLSDGLVVGIGSVAGAASERLDVTIGAGFVAGTQFRVVLDNSCTTGTVTSQPITVSACPADVNGDRGVDINDLLAFLAGFEQGGAPADLTDGGMACGGDGGVDINDLLFFLDHFEAGC